MDGVSPDPGLDAASGGGVEVVAVGQGQVAFAGGSVDGRSEGMFAGTFGGRGEREEVVLAQAAVGQGLDVPDVWGASGEGAGLVECNPCGGASLTTVRR